MLLYVFASIYIYINSRTYTSNSEADFEKNIFVFDELWIHCPVLSWLPG